MGNVSAVKTERESWVVTQWLVDTVGVEIVFVGFGMRLGHDQRLENFTYRFSPYELLIKGLKFQDRTLVCTGDEVAKPVGHHETFFTFLGGTEKQFHEEVTKKLTLIQIEGAALSEALKND